MFHRPVRLSLRLIAIYAIMCVFWVGFAAWVAPNIAAFNGLKLSILDIAGAALLAAVIHSVIVPFIYGIDNNRIRYLDAPRQYSNVNVALVVFSAAFLAVAVLSGIRGDYYSYLQEWMAILAGGDPWERGAWINNYGPLFNVLAPMVWVNPLANK